MREICTLLDIPFIESKTKFWFIRTNGGDLYEAFIAKDIIAIGWDGLGNIDYFKNTPRETVIEKIKATYPKEERPGYIYNQVNEFINDIQINDYIVIPSKKSEILTFGRVMSGVYEETLSNNDEYYQPDINEFKISYSKRRRVEWIETKFRHSLDPHLYRIIYSHNTIVDASEYSNSIMRTLYDCYVLDNEFHGVFRINSIEDIPGPSLTKFQNYVLEFIEEVKGSEISNDDYSVKMNLNSPGDIDYATIVPTVIIAITILIGAFSGHKFTLKIAKKDSSDNAVELSQETKGFISALERFQKSSTDNKIKINEAKLNTYKEQLKIEQKYRKRD